MTDKPNTTVNFRKLLLNRCQKEFEKDKVDDDAFEKKHRELEAATSVSPSAPKVSLKLFLKWSQAIQIALM